MSSGVSFEDVIMGLDIDTKHIGWSIVRGHDHLTGHWKFNKANLGRFFLTYHKLLRDHVQDHQPAVICIENPYVGFPSAVGPLYMLRGVTLMALASYRGAIDFVDVGTWKKQICGRGNISTKEKKAGRIVEIVNQMGFRVEQIDEADALCIALHARKKLTGRIV